MAPTSLQIQRCKDICQMISIIKDTKSIVTSKELNKRHSRRHTSDRVVTQLVVLKRMEKSHNSISKIMNCLISRILCFKLHHMGRESNIFHKHKLLPCSNRTRLNMPLTRDPYFQEALELKVEIEFSSKKQRESKMPPRTILNIKEIYSKWAPSGFRINHLK